jgi:hypothetical protein
MQRSMHRFLFGSCVLVAACSSTGGSIFENGGTIATPPTTPGGPIALGADGPCETREDKNGCACTTDGTSRECWPGVVGQSHAGLCRPGTQICSTAGSKEFVSQTWGECTGYSLPAGGCGNTSDGAGGGNTSDGTGGGNTGDGAGGGNTSGGPGGGNTGDGSGGRGEGYGGRGNTDDGSGGGHTDDGYGGYNGFGGFGTGFGGGNTNDGSGGRGSGYGGGRTNDGSGGGSNGYGGGRTNDGSGGGRTRDGDVCACPGQIRWCDDPVFCNWGNQTCLPDGTWGPCKEVKTQPAGCDPGQFDDACCDRLGLCCAWDNSRLVGPCQSNGCP